MSERIAEILKLIEEKTELLEENADDLRKALGERQAEVKRYREALEYYAEHAVNDTLAQDVLAGS